MKYTLERDDYLTMPEVRRLRKACIEWDAADRKLERDTGIRVWMIVDLALSTGLRVSELASMKIEDLDWDGGAIKVNRRKKKKPVSNHIPLPGPLAKHLRDYLAGRTTGPVVLGQRGPLTRRGWQLAWESACRKAGIRPLSIHKARHTFGTMMYRKTKDLRLVQEWLGHSSSVITEIYSHVNFSDMSRAAEKMFEEE